MKFRHTLSLLAAALVLASCGGGDAGNQTPRVKFTSLVSFGDSLSDVGTHNVSIVAALGAGKGSGRWTVNSAEGGEIWTERLAAVLGVPKPCPAETGLLPNIFNFPTVTPTDKLGCFSYAQGSARVENPVGPASYALQLALANTDLPDRFNIGLLAKPVKNQMAAHLAAVGGSYSGNELVVVMAGANDVFMELALTAPVLGPAQAVTNVAAAGAALGQLIKTQVVAKGAKRVLVLNVPDVAGTPFARSLDAQTRGLIDTMVQQFNAQLANQLAGVPEVRLGDAYTTSKDQAANPAAYGLSNVTGVACGPNALSNPPTANGTSLVCNASNKIAGDTSRYQFADDVHPSPYGHQLLSQFAARELAQAGWL